MPNRCAVCNLNIHSDAKLNTNDTIIKKLKLIYFIIFYHLFYSSFDKISKLIYI